MRIFDKHPSFELFVHNEIDTLEYISTHSLLSYFGDLTSVIETYASKYISRRKQGQTKSFNFYGPVFIEIEKHIQKVVIGANVGHGFEECSYSLTILDKENEKKIIRKFHFDYALASIKTNQQVPSYHLQYGGKISSQMKQDELDDSKLDKWLSVPRLNFHPINLALLLDLMLCEFKTTESDKISQTSEWRALILKNEKLISLHYYNSIASYLSSSAYSQNRLLRDFCYGK